MRVLHKKELGLQSAEKLYREIEVQMSQYMIDKGEYPTHVELTKEEYRLLQLLCFLDSSSVAPMKVYNLEIIIKD